MPTHDTASSSLVRPAQEQITTPAAETLHSANSGLIIHRTGQIRYEFRAEGREFARVLQAHFNRALHPHATTFIYEEIFGTENRFHWLVHMKAPNEYSRFIRASDHDEGVRTTVQENRLEERGNGNWERMFEEGSFQEHVLCPQHGIVQLQDKQAFKEYFALPAHTQTAVPVDRILHSANSGVIVLRSARLRYAFREEGRRFCQEWQEYLNRKLTGQVTTLLYEEIWGQQDRLYWLMHMRDLSDYREVMALSERDGDYRQLFTKELSGQRGSGNWASMFVDGSIQDCVLAPHHPGMGLGWS